MEGICLYPVIDRPDWDNYRHWHHCGLWDMRRGRDGSLVRVLNVDYAAELRRRSRTRSLRYRLLTASLHHAVPPTCLAVTKLHWHGVASRDA